MGMMKHRHPIAQLTVPRDASGLALLDPSPPGPATLGGGVSGIWSPVAEAAPI